jgi:hypothetical protein
MLVLLSIFGSITPAPLVLAALMATSGALTSLSVFFYLKALERDSVISVVPALQLAPVVAFIFDIVFFGADFSYLNILGSIGVIVGAIFLTVKIEKVSGKDTFQLRTFMLSSGSAIFLAVSASFFKHFAASFDYWTVQFYEYIGVCLLSLVFFLFSRVLKRHILELLKNYKRQKVFIAMNSATEAVMIAGDLFLNYATMVLPLTFVFSANAAQPAILLILGILLSGLVPSFESDLRGRIMNVRSLSLVALIIVSTAAALS